MEGCFAPSLDFVFLESFVESGLKMLISTPTYARAREGVHVVNLLRSCVLVEAFHILFMLISYLLFDGPWRGTRHDGRPIGYGFRPEYSVSQQIH